MYKRQILSAALIYHDYVAIPRQNRELVGELKTCFPEDIPPGGGSPGEKEEQAGREPEVSAVDLRFLQSQYPDVRGWLTIPESGKMCIRDSIEAEDGSAYHPDQAGTYIATYWVVPKDTRDSYSVTRKIILTDTEGQAHTEENGGQKQKEDTKSEEDSETPVQEIPEVEVTVSGEDADAQAARELEEKIADGEVMMLSGAENTFTARETAHLEKGETIYYPSYIGNYLKMCIRDRCCV